MGLEKFRNFISNNLQPLLLAFILWLVSSLLVVKVFSQTKQDVWNYIEQSDIQQKEIVYKQVLKETGHLKCTKCSLRFNNLLGFRYNHQHMEFDKWQDSIDYYIRWQIRKGYKGGNYYEFLKQKWGAPDMERYCRTLKQIRI